MSSKYDRIELVGGKGFSVADVAKAGACREE